MIKEQKAFQNLAISNKKDQNVKAKEEAEGQKQQDAILSMLSSLPDTLFKDCD